MTIADYLSTLAQMTKKEEEYILAQALEVGLRQMWREEMLAHYLRGEITRDEVIDLVGLTWVELADEQKETVLEDIRWALES
jgi:hypothetical protein